MTILKPRVNLNGLDMNMAAKIRARRAPVVRKRIIPTATKPVVPGAPAVDPMFTKANNTVMGFMNPMLSRLAAQRVAAEANARQVAPQHVAALQTAMQVPAKAIDTAYDRGIQSSSAVNEALANRLGGVGQAAGADLTTKLAQIGAQGAGELENVYKGAANAGYAGGTADLQHLIAQRAEGAAYQAKLPGIAAIEGNRDLSQALSEMRQNFGEQERDYQDQAAEQSFNLYNQLRGEKREDQENTAQRIAAQQELYSKQKIALQALAASSQSKQEKMFFDSQMKALDRQNKIDLANIRAETSIYGVDTRAATAASKPVKGPALTGPANQQFITVNGKIVKNPNYKPGGGQAGGTPAQRRLKNNQAATNLRSLLLNPMTRQPKAWTKNASNEELMRTINGAIEQAGIGPNTPDGIAQRKAILKLLGIPSGPKGNPYYPGGHKPDGKVS